MLIPNPILLAGATPALGLTLEVTAALGGLAGYVLLGQLGPTCTVEVSEDDGETWAAPSYPHTLLPGLLRLTRTDESGGVTTLRALAPVEEEVPAPTPLDNGVPVSDLSAPSGGRLTGAFTLPAGVDSLSVTASPGTGEVDLFLYLGEPDGPGLADATAASPDTAEVTLSSPAPGEYTVVMDTGPGFSDLTLTATWQ